MLKNYMRKQTIQYKFTRQFIDHRKHIGSQFTKEALHEDIREFIIQSNVAKAIKRFSWVDRRLYAAFRQWRINALKY